jgi:hypothetical protein
MGYRRIFCLLRAERSRAGSLVASLRLTKWVRPLEGGRILGTFRPMLNALALTSTLLEVPRTRRAAETPSLAECGPESRRCRRR